MHISTAGKQIIRSKQFKRRQYFPHFGSDNDFKGIVVNRALPFLHGGSREITLTQSPQAIPVKQHCISYA